LEPPPLAEKRSLLAELQATLNTSDAEAHDANAKPRTKFICAPKDYKRRRAPRPKQKWI
jgi:hypothetical protein